MPNAPKARKKKGEINRWARNLRYEEIYEVLGRISHAKAQTANGQVEVSNARVIVQISSVAVPHAELASYLESVRVTEIPHYEFAPGLQSVLLLQRECVGYVEVMTVSRWSSENALQRFTKNELIPKAVGSGGVIILEKRTYELAFSCEGKLGVAGPEGE